MEKKRIHKLVWIALGVLLILGFGPAAFAAISGIGSVAAQAKSNLENVAKLITAGSYVAGMAFGVGAVVKFKAHKDNPTQVHIGQPIALLFVGAALMFIPTVFKASGGTLFSASGVQATVSGISSF